MTSLKQFNLVLSPTRVCRRLDTIDYLSTRSPLHLGRFLYHGTRQDDLQRWDAMNVLQMLVVGREFASLLLLIFRSVDTMVALLQGQVLIRRQRTAAVCSLF